jgi:hypothetical protein
VSNSLRVGIVSLSVLFIAGAFMLSRVDIQEGVRVAREEDARPYLKNKEISRQRPGLFREAAKRPLLSCTRTWRRSELSRSEKLSASRAS